ncbi:two-component system, cell cycle sensor histidine kinase and response regulator CckA [Rhodospira trueperi]|uniref:histidine kinase n=2 Tax=Rhodospira trueperi TaxID=69960 RepID=A0A1G6ZYJ8_9PROT|nr:two-component system, cell cycle sensor histidine kinase and response regulator CckA [Rhodospira trueperi]
MSCVSGKRRFIRLPAVWGLVMGTLVLLGALVADHPAVRAALPDTVEVAAPTLAGVGVTLLVLSLIGLARVLAQSQRNAAVNRVLIEMLDDESEARLVLDCDGTVLLANAAARRLWPTLDPPTDLRARLFDPLRLAGLDDLAEPLGRLAAANTAGYGEHLTLALRPYDADDPEAPNTPALQEPEWWDVALRLVRPAGRTPDAASSATRWPRLWLARDVTARRAIDEVLTRERESLSDFLYFLPVGLYSADANGRIRFVNQRMARWLDREPEALREASLSKLVDGGAPPMLDGDWRGEVRFVSASGRRFSALVSQGSHDDAGELLTRTVVMRDAIDAPPAAVGQDGVGPWRWDRMFRWLFDGAPVGIALTDPEGHLTDCNHALQALLGQRRDDLLDQSLVALVAEPDRARITEAVNRVLRGAANAGEQIDVTLAPGPGRHQSDSGPVTAALFLGPMGGTEDAGHGPEENAPPPAPPVVEGIVAHLIDTSAQRSLERQFAQAQKMQAMGQLAGGVAHDFNNLLTAMIGYSDLLLQRHGTGDPSFADIMQIRQNANRAANLVRQLLAFSRRQPLQPRRLDVAAALSELSHLLRRLLGETIQFRLLHGRDVDHVVADPGQFDQVIINLAVNARDAMPDGGTLTIATRLDVVEKPVERGVETMPSGEYVVIEIRDTGKGIDHEHVARIFEPFFTTKGGSTAGTGLGLSTVYGILRQTGGFIDVESAPGEGTAFTIRLPRWTAQADADGHADSDGAGPVPADTTASAGLDDAEPGADQPPSHEEIEDLSGAGTILLVEDEDPVRAFAARALRNKGYTVLEARSGESALDILGEPHPIALLITDMVMPGVDGATLARTAREQRPDLRVIIISGYSEDSARGDILDQPRTHFLPKPFSLKLLAETVKSVLAR